MSALSILTEALVPAYEVAGGGDGRDLRRIRRLARRAAVKAEATADDATRPLEERSAAHLRFQHADAVARCATAFLRALNHRRAGRIAIAARHERNADLCFGLIHTATHP